MSVSLHFTTLIYVFVPRFSCIFVSLSVFTHTLYFLPLENERLICYILKAKHSRFFFARFHMIL